MVNPSIEAFVDLSQDFSEKIGLLTPRIREAIQTISPYGLSAMCMLGTSLFAVGDLDKIIPLLSDYGPVYRCMVDTQGARLLSQ
jgi:pantoate kinase